MPELTTLPPGKQRRTVVRALESHPKLFKKIGWGTWTFAGSTETFSRNPNGTILINNKEVRDPEISAEKAAEMMMGIMSPETSAYVSDEEVVVDDDIDIGETVVDFKLRPPRSGRSLGGVGGVGDDNKDNQVKEDNNISTDEEDWKSLGPNSLRSRELSILTSKEEEASPIEVHRKQSFGVSSLNTRLDSLRVGNGNHGLPSPASSSSPFNGVPSIFASRVQGEPDDSGLASFKQSKERDNKMEDEAVAALVQLSSSYPASSSYTPA